MRIKLKLMIAGVSVICSCLAIADLLQYLGFPDHFGNIPMIAIVASAGMIMIFQSKKTR